jgi:hypothetical protein
MRRARPFGHTQPKVKPMNIKSRSIGRLSAGLLSVVGLVSMLAACAPAVTGPSGRASAGLSAELSAASTPSTLVLAKGPETMAVQVSFEPAEAMVLVEGKQVANGGVVILQSHPTRRFHIEASAPGYACTHAEMARGGFSSFEGRLQHSKPGQAPCTLGHFRDGLEDEQAPRTVAVGVTTSGI